VASPEPYSVVVQASPQEILHARDPGRLNLRDLAAWPRVAELIVALPDMEGAGQAAQCLAAWGFPAHFGETYDVCARILAAHERLAPQPFSVRVLAIWKHVDLEYVDRLVDCMRASPCDVAAAPRDFDVTFAADVASHAALRRVRALPGAGQEEARARFNPWGYMEMHPEAFEVRVVEPAPLYPPERTRAVLDLERCHPENEFFGRDYAGSRYHFFADQLPAGLRILDVACGSGQGSELLSRRAAFVLGVDYLEPYVRAARARYPESERLAFEQGDAQTFLWRGRPGQFDLVVSLHTLEHVPDDRAMLAALHRNLRPGGQAILEVPLLCRRPLGVPVNPFHLREYGPEAFLALVRAAGFVVERTYGVSRSFYGPPERARDALQVRACKAG
jgi:2-polyprenyl-3-methyl-5-hydroxy-6-metoxy-1,4-benzoquinol methylase